MYVHSFCMLQRRVFHFISLSLSPVSESEVIAAAKGFRKAAGKNAMSRDDFLQLLAEAGMSGKLLASQCWVAVAPKGAESINLTDFVRILGSLQRGDPQKRLQLTFTLLDVNNDGTLTREGVTKIVSQVHLMCGQLVSYNGRIYGSAEEFCDHFFRELDVRNADKISFSDYENGAYKNLEMISTLALFGGTSSIPSANVYSAPRQSIIS